MTNNTNKNFFNVNFFDNTISGSVANFKKASKGSGAAYEELCRLMKAHKGFELVQIEPKKHIEGKKQSYEGLNLEFMKTYIGIQETKADDLAEFTKVKKYAEATKIAVFPFMKKWFIGKYGVEDAYGATDKLGNIVKHFDMEKAKAEISAFRQTEAQTFVVKASEEDSKVQTLKKTA